MNVHFVIDNVVVNPGAPVVLSPWPSITRFHWNGVLYSPYERILYNGKIYLCAYSSDAVPLSTFIGS